MKYLLLMASVVVAAGGLMPACGQETVTGGGGQKCASAGGTCVLGDVECTTEAPDSAQDCNTNPPNPGGGFCCLTFPDAGSASDSGGKETDAAASDASVDAAVSDASIADAPVPNLPGDAASSSCGAPDFSAGCPCSSGAVCVTRPQSGGEAFGCTDVPPVCGDTVTCDCMACACSQLGLSCAGVGVDMSTGAGLVVHCM